MSTVRRRQTYLIQDPHDFDAIQFIRTFDTYFGLRPVCFYADAKARFYAEQRFPILASDVIERSEIVDFDDLASFAARIAPDHEVLAVIPYREDTVEVAAELCEHVDLDWNRPETLRLFRDKHALKVHVGSSDPDVRLPEFRSVRTIGDLDAGPLPGRFVLKPNDGFGNRAIGMFDRDDLELAARHLAAHPGITWILEEFIGGTEFHIDGQVRDDGTVTCLAVLEYLRAEANGYPTVYLGEIQCTTDHPEFAALTDYAVRLLRATGLRRCPFHLEVKLDDRGPCVVDLGARMPSEGGGLTISRLHPERPDAFAVAAHDYLAPNSFAPGPVDWTVYDRHRTVLVYGMSEEHGVIDAVGGLDEVEAMPEFVRWAVRPGPGDELLVSTDLRSAPYIVELNCMGDRDDALALIAQVREMVTVDIALGRFSAAVGRLANVRRRAARKAPWLLHRAMQGVKRSE